MTENEQRLAAKQFAQDWAGRGDEKQDTQLFWVALLQKVYGVEEPDKYIQFELPVKLSHTSFIDGYIEATRVLIEQKGLDIDLKKGYKQSDGSLLSPFQQARRYAGYLPHNQNPRWIVVCNFQEFHIHDMNRPNDAPEVVKLADLEKEYARLQFLVDTGNEQIKREMEISLQAGELVGVLYDAFLKQYKEPNSPETLKSLNKLCVRIVFCLYAEDAGIFGQKNIFHDYLSQFDAKGARKALRDLFRVLDQKREDRDPYLADDDPLLAAFPYVNGGLFADENIEIPPFTEELLKLLLDNASGEFDWSEISPTIFGAVFESTLNPETRRSGGMHYTSIENIHKVIDPLFLNDLNAEYEGIVSNPITKTRNQRLKEFQQKLAGLTFLDPACGSGNFLTETYLSLRRLENKVVQEIIATQRGAQAGQIVMGETIDPIKVSISQFYGIEINDFAVTVAKTALWIAESQMIKETEEIVRFVIDFLPLKTYANIVEGNALSIDWATVVPKEKLNYIMGNPPFVGYTYQSKSQKDDLQHVFPDVAKNIDYVSGWYFKASGYMIGTGIRAALVSTNSITQGEQVSAIWKPLTAKYGVHIDFAHRTFRWDSEASLKAHVHCVIIGFSVAPFNGQKRLFDGDRSRVVANINAYLLDAENLYIEKRTKPLCDVPLMNKGSQPTDGGNLIILPDELDEFLAKEPNAKKYIRMFLGSEEFINGKKRYCLWLKDASPKELLNMPMVLDRIKKVKAFRLSSKKVATQKWADMPALFTEDRQPDKNYIAIPEVSSENRKYIPIGFLSPETICSNKLQLIPCAEVYHFGILTSNIHMAWMRAVCGRLEMRYDYSAKIVYNNFPWPNPTEAQQAKIEATAQAILNARALYPDCSLADLYDETAMPPELRTAHQKNDRAVWEAYGKKWSLSSEAECVAELMKLYQALTT